MSEQHISIRPHLQSGQPCLSGTRLPALQMASHYVDSGADTPMGVLHQYEGIDVEGLALCCYYAALYGPRRFRPWRTWALGFPIHRHIWTLDVLPPREAIS